MTELREIDIDGCPLLFHAASSNCEHSCFRTAKYIVFSVLGKGGFGQQFEVVDGLGRGILMHAARSNHVDNFREVFDMCREAADRVRPHPPAIDTASADARLLREVLGKVDRIGKNCLHHAAEAGCYTVLHEVIKSCGALYEEMNSADLMGRTPIMYVLRNDGCRGQAQPGPTLTLREKSLRKKFYELYEALPDAPFPQGAPVKTGWMEPSRVPPPYLPVKKTSVDARAVTELMHAARGGLVSLELALNKLPLASRISTADGFKVGLDKALDVKMTIGNTQEEQSHRTKAWGWALLLAAAAKLGDTDVLYHVLLAIKVGQNIFVFKAEHKQH